MSGFIIMISIAALLLVSGCLIRFGKGYGLIAGYNTMSAEDKARVDTTRMGKVVSTSLFVMAVLIASGGWLYYQNLDTPGTLAILLILPVTIVTLVQSKKCVSGETTSKHKGSRIEIGLMIFVFVVIAAMGCLFYYGTRPADISLGGKSLTVSGMYGTCIDLTGAKSISLVDSLPEHLEKTNGFDWDTVKKGSFQSNTVPITLYVDTKVSKYIVADFGSSELILNCSTESATQTLYTKLKSVVS
ncbi:MAG TPA: DUF3784 domain-containing protein [Caproicibacter sp.]|nr:DUF3784 domain-containing protein [Caproicibacter sp.]